MIIEVAGKLLDPGRFGSFSATCSHQLWPARQVKFLWCEKNYHWFGFSQIFNNGIIDHFLRHASINFEQLDKLNLFEVVRICLPIVSYCFPFSSIYLKYQIFIIILWWHASINFKQFNKLKLFEFQVVRRRKNIMCWIWSIMINDNRTIQTHEDNVIDQG